MEDGDIIHFSPILEGYPLTLSLNLCVIKTTKHFLQIYYPYQIALIKSISGHKVDI